MHRDARRLKVARVLKRGEIIFLGGVQRSPWSTPNAGDNGPISGDSLPVSKHSCVQTTFVRVLIDFLAMLTYDIGRPTAMPLIALPPHVLAEPLQSRRQRTLLNYGPQASLATPTRLMAKTASSAHIRLMAKTRPRLFHRSEPRRFIISTFGLMRLLGSSAAFPAGPGGVIIKRWTGFRACKFITCER